MKKKYLYKFNAWSSDLKGYSTLYLREVDNEEQAEIVRKNEEVVGGFKITKELVHTFDVPNDEPVTPIVVGELVKESLKIEAEALEVEADTPKVETNVNTEVKKRGRPSLK